MSASSNRSWRCRFSASTWSSSAMTRWPRPASARAMAQGAPTQPAPMRRTRQSARGRSGEVFIEAEITLAAVGQEGEHVLAGAELAGDVHRHEDRRARAHAHQEALLARQGDFHGVGFGIADSANFIDDAAVEVPGDEARRQP